MRSQSQLRNDKNIMMQQNLPSYVSVPTLPAIKYKKDSTLCKYPNNYILVINLFYRKFEVFADMMLNTSVICSLKWLSDKSLTISLNIPENPCGHLPTVSRNPQLYQEGLAGQSAQNAKKFLVIY